MKNFRNKAVAVFLSAGALGAVAFLTRNAASTSAINSGTICTEETEYNPFHFNDADGQVEPGPELPPFTGAHAACTKFNQNLGGHTQFDWQTYFGEIHALEPRWSTVNNANGLTASWEPTVENADIVFEVGHGSSTTSDGHRFLSYYIWDFIKSKDLYLGTPISGPGLSVLSIYSCYSLTPNVVAQNGTMPSPFPPRLFEDAVVEDLPTRWLPAMAGGLRMVTGTWHMQTTAGAATTAQNYGTYLKTNTVSEAWRHAAFDGDASNAPAVFATGTDAPSCNSKIAHMTLTNLSSYGRLRNYSWGNWCWSAWW